jgi:penicillin amidase
VNASLDLRKLTDGLKAWDGDSKTDPVYFALSTLAEDEMTKTLLDRVTANFIPKELREIPYTGTMKHSWLLTLMNSPGGTRAFGLEDVEFATYIMKKLLRAQKNIKPHQESNRWIVQHPFANGLPVIGWLFKIKNFDQWGAADLVDAERPTFGPSVRLIMDMKNPEKSTWILPVGQSGHIGSPYYSDQQDFWHQGKKLQIFKEEEWGQWEKPN